MSANMGWLHGDRIREERRTIVRLNMYIYIIQRASLCGRHMPPATLAQGGKIETICEADKGS